jgi:hypothetical protein
MCVKQEHCSKNLELCSKNPTATLWWSFVKKVMYNLDARHTGAHNTFGFFLNYTVQRRRSQHAHTHSYEYTYANPTLMNTSEGLSTDKSGEHLVVDGNVAYHLTHNTKKKSWNESRR